MGTWFVDVMCRNSVRGSSAVKETVIRTIMMKSNKLKFCVFIITFHESQFDTIRVD